MNLEPFRVRREQVEVDGTTLSYLTCGNNDADPLLLLHGTFWSRVWQPVLPALGQHFHCVALDFPGFGQSDGELDVEHASVPALADTVLRAADALNLDTFAVAAPMTLAVAWPSIWPSTRGVSAAWS